MNKTDLIKDLSKELNVDKKEVKKTIAALEKCILSELAEGGKVTLTGFGTFSVTERKERKGRNPQTGSDLIIPKHNAPVFRFSNGIKKSFK